MNKKYIAAGVGLFAAGAGGGFLLGRQLTIKKVEAWANEEIQSVKDTYKNDVSRKEGVFATPQKAAEFLIGEEVIAASRPIMDELMEDAGYRTLASIIPTSETDDVESKESLLAVEEKDKDPEYEGTTDYTKFSKQTSSQIEFPDAETITEAIHENLWANTARVDGGVILEDIEQEPGDFVVERHPDKPYVISQDFFMEDTEYDDNKLSMVFFEEDGQLIDEREQLIPNVEEIVGEVNMTKFGVGSNDRNAVYIRNEKLKSDIEVIRDKRSYNEVVLGIKPDKASSTPRKLRDDDDR